MTPLLLDTNTVSEIVSYRRPDFRTRLRSQLPRGIMVSSISYGETMFGLSYNPAATRIAEMARAFFAETTILPFTAETAVRYGALRAEMRRAGKALQPLDMLIAAHALEAGATLVSNDHAFRFVPGLEVEDWTEARG